MKPEAMKLGRSFFEGVVVSISPLRKLLHNLSQHQRYQPPSSKICIISTATLFSSWGRKRSPLPLRRYNSRLARG
jgi:hypothetical protein